MKRIKDFIYDKNDIVIALAVLVIAALIINWRMGVIMDYPHQMFTAANPTTQQGDDQTPDADATDSPGGDGQTADQPGTADPADGQDQPTGDQPGQTDAPPATGDGGLWSSGMLTKNVDVEVTGNSASEAIGCLVDAGLFDDYADYQQICEENGLDHEKVRAGSFTFNQGDTKKDVAKAINWS